MHNLHFWGGGREQIWLTWFSQAEGHQSENNTDHYPTRPVLAAWVNQHLTCLLPAIETPRPERSETRSGSGCGPGPWAAQRESHLGRGNAIFCGAIGQKDMLL
ncbi:MAG: hypothetical protein U5L00_15775 [Desulfovermiculus sp.]|nr:hypothetical protein [Desulfovermiculus sp.]